MSAQHTQEDGLTFPIKQIFKALDFMRDNAPAYAQAKAERIYLEQFRKTKKALLMQEAERNGVKSVQAQERDAYAHPEYLELLEGLRSAVLREEELRWLIAAAEAKVEAWRTVESTRRAEARAV